MLGWTVAGAIFGLTGVVVAVASYVKFRRVRRPLFHTYVQTVVDDVGLSDLEVRYKDRGVPRVSRALVLFWNGGTATIRKNDIAPADSLRIEVPHDAEILAAVVVARTREANRSDVSVQEESPTTLPLTFDFLDPNDGLAVALLHTGDAHNESTTVTGTVMEAPHDGAPERVGQVLPSDRAKPAAIQMVVIWLVGVALGAGVLMWRFSLPVLPTIPIYAVVLGLVIYTAISAILPKGERRRRPYVIPSELLHRAEHRYQ